jgi:hypothetical protein
MPKFPSLLEPNADWKPASSPLCCCIHQTQNQRLGNKVYFSKSSPQASTKATRKDPSMWLWSWSQVGGGGGGTLPIYFDKP